MLAEPPMGPIVQDRGSKKESSGTAFEAKTGYAKDVSKKPHRNRSSEMTVGAFSDAVRPRRARIVSIRPNRTPAEARVLFVPQQKPDRAETADP